MRTTQQTLLMACLAAMLLASSCATAAAARPRRHLSQAVASSSAVAGPGETVIAGSNAVSENGKLTVSKVDASGAGPGTVVNCQQNAANGQIKSKECPPSSGSSSWDTAPACKKAPSTYKVEFGTVDKKPWAFEDGRSCALRGARGEELVKAP